MRKIPGLLSLTAAAAALLALSSQGGAAPSLEGSGTPARQPRTVEPFEGIKLVGPIHLEFKIGPKLSVEISADDNLLAFVTTKVEKRALTVTLDHGRNKSLRTRSTIRAIITAPSLTGLALAGPAEAVVTGLSADQFSLAVSGPGEAVVSGAVKRFNAAVQGPGEIEARGLIAGSATVAVEGTGEIELHAVDSVTAAISGTGEIDIYGKPPKVTRVVDGKGEVRVHP